MSSLLIRYHSDKDLKLFIRTETKGGDGQISSV